MEAEGQSDVKHRLQRAKIRYSLKKLFSVCHRFYKFLPNQQPNSLIGLNDYGK